MTDQPEQNRISLQDNSDQEPPTQSEMSSSEDKTETSQQEGGKWYEKPEGMGNSAGEWVQDKLNPVGQYAGKGLETVGKPVGGLVDPIVGGVMRAGEAWGNEASVGFGNKEGGPAKQAEAEGERMKQPTGGEEQNADNPLGLNKNA